MTQAIDPTLKLVRRVKAIEDLPDTAIRCSALGRHIGFGHDDPIMTKVDGWGPLNSWRVTFVCDCGRWRKEVVDVDTGNVLTLTPQYGGGVLMSTGYAPTRSEARSEWYRRVIARADAELRRVAGPKRTRKRKAVAAEFSG